MRGPPLVLDQTEAQGAKKVFFLRLAPPYLRFLMTTPPLLSQRQDPALIIIIVYLLLGYNTNE